MPQDFFRLDVVDTSLGEYVVIDYVHPNVSPEHRLCDRVSLCITPEFKPYTPEGYDRIASRLAELGDKWVNAHSASPYYGVHALDVPAGLIGETLSAENIQRAGSVHYSSLVESISCMPNFEDLLAELGSLESNVEDFQQKLTHSLWNQAIIDSAPNKLHMGGLHAPQYIVQIEDCFALVDNRGIDENGRYPGNVHFYRPVDPSQEQSFPIGVFPRKTIQLWKTKT